MARRPNYGFEKRQKELDRQRKKEEKAERKRLRKEGDDGGDGEAAGPGESGTDAGSPPTREGVADGRGTP